MAIKGDSIVKSSDLDLRLRLLETKINSVLAFIVFKGATQINNFLIQSNIETIAGAGTTVTFAKPYKAATIPVVVGISQAKDKFFALNASPTNAGFTGYSTLHDGTGSDSICHWVAIGERG